MNILDSCNLSFNPNRTWPWPLTSYFLHNYFHKMSSFLQNIRAQYNASIGMWPICSEDLFHSQNGAYILRSQFRCTSTWMVMTVTYVDSDMLPS